MNKRLITSFIVVMLLISFSIMGETQQEELVPETAAVPLLPEPPKELITTVTSPTQEQEDLAFLDRFKDSEADSDLVTAEDTPDVLPERPKEEQLVTTSVVAQKVPVVTNLEKPSRFLQPWEFGDPDELIEIEFDNAELSNLISYIEKKYQLTFILDDQIKPLPQGGKSVLGTKISFKTHHPLSKKQAWNIFVTFLDMAGLAPSPTPGAGVFHIASIDPKSPLSVYKGPLPLYIGVDESLLPDNDTRIRYVYFVENTSLDIIKNVVESMKSATSPNLVAFPELRAFVITDRAVNIRAIITIIRELDKVNMPETLSVIKLRRTDATKVAELYKALIRDEAQNSLQARLLGGRRASTMSYFSESTRVIPEPNTNTLILLGTRDSIRRIEDFLVKEIDREVDVPFSQLHIYTLKYVDAESVAAIVREAVQFQPESEAAKYGGVRNGNKYFKPLSITAEKSGNRLVINADYEDYLKIHELLDQIDVEQPQVAIKMIIMNVDVTNAKSFGTQVRDKVPSFDGLLGNQVNFQTSGLAGSPIVQNSDGTGATRLLGDLVRLVSGITAPGNTFLTFGSDAYGVWGILGVLETLTKVSVIANPFIVTTHKYPSNIKTGEIRRVVTGITNTATGPESSFNDLEAKLEVSVTPQVSYEGLITLDVSVVLEQFTQSGVNSGNRTHKEIKTSVIVNNKNVLGLGGLMRDHIDEIESGIPILKDIPIVGWFFKNKTKVVTTSSLLILISPEIIPAHHDEFAQKFTQTKVDDALAMMREYKTPTVDRDPINRWFFGSTDKTHDEYVLEEFNTESDRYIDPSQKDIIKENIKKEAEKTRKIIDKRNKRLYKTSSGLCNQISNCAPRRTS